MNTQAVKTVYLNIKDSVLERGKDEKINSCIGAELQYQIILDGCPGDWGWLNSMPVNCDYELKYCNGPDQLKYGIKCSEWQRACTEIKTSNRVHIDIENINATRVRTGRF